MASPMKIVVVGGVAAGPKAAARARRCDPTAEITLFEQGEFVSYAGCGLPFFISGAIPDIKELLATPVGVVRDAGFFKNVKGFDLHTGKRVTAIERGKKQVQVTDVKTGEVETAPYDRLVLATGARPVRPPIEGIDLGNIFPLQTPKHALEIREAIERDKVKKAVLIGAGWIGLEVTEALVHRGIEVTLVEALDFVAPNLLDFEIAALLSRHLTEKGVAVRTQERAARFIGNSEGKVKKVVTDKGEYDADLVLIAIGVRPNVDLAREAGLELGQTGAIKVDDYLRTSDPDIYAGGDCIESKHLLTGKPAFVSSGQLANIHGRIIGTNLTGGQETFKGFVGTSIAKVFDFSVGAAGLKESVARDLGFDVETALVPGPDHAHYYPQSGVVGLKMVADRKTRRLLGVQVVGPGDGSKRIDVAATAITLGATLDTMSQLNLAYSPPFSSALDNLLVAANVMLNKLEGRAPSVTPMAVQEMTEQGQDFMLLDVRTPQEFNEIRLKNPNTFFMPLGRLREKAPEFPKDKTIIPFCKLSLRGYEAVKILEGLGFKDVKFMDGGVVQWPYELEKPQ